MSRSDVRVVPLGAAVFTAVLLVGATAEARNIDLREHPRYSEFGERRTEALHQENPYETGRGLAEVDRFLNLRRSLRGAPLLLDIGAGKGKASTDALRESPRLRAVAVSLRHPDPEQLRADKAEFGRRYDYLEGRFPDVELPQGTVLDSGAFATYHETPDLAPLLDRTKVGRTAHVLMAGANHTFLLTPDGRLGHWPSLVQAIGGVEVLQNQTNILSEPYQPYSIGLRRTGPIDVPRLKPLFWALGWPPFRVALVDDPRVWSHTGTGAEERARLLQSLFVRSIVGPGLRTHLDSEHLDFREWIPRGTPEEDASHAATRLSLVAADAAPFQKQPLSPEDHNGRLQALVGLAEALQLPKVGAYFGDEIAAGRTKKLLRQFVDSRLPPVAR